MCYCAPGKSSKMPCFHAMGKQRFCVTPDGKFCETQSEYAMSGRDLMRHCYTKGTGSSRCFWSWGTTGRHSLLPAAASQIPNTALSSVGTFTSKSQLRSTSCDGFVWKLLAGSPTKTQPPFKDKVNSWKTAARSRLLS